MTTTSSAWSLLMVFLVALSLTEARLCSRYCPKIYLPVCGSNGVTYGNRCLLDYKTCRTFGLVTFVHEGPCNKCDIICTTDYTPVCASNGKTYPNVCSMKAAACRKNITLKVVHPGNCYRPIKG